MNGICVGTQSQYGRFEEEAKLLSLPEIERPILSPSHYTDYTIPARLRREQGVKMLVLFTWTRGEFSDCTNSSVGWVTGDLYPNLAERILALRKDSAESWNYIKFYFMTLKSRQKIVAINTLRTGDADLRFYVTTVQDE